MSDEQGSLVPGLLGADAQLRPETELRELRHENHDETGRVAQSEQGAGLPGRPATAAPGAGAGEETAVKGSLHHHWHPEETPEVLAAMIARAAARYVPHSSQMDAISSPARYSSKAETTPQEAEDV